MEQRSYEWQQARLGHITASAAGCIVEGSRQDMRDVETKAKILSHVAKANNWTAANIATCINESRSRVDRLLGVMIEEGTIYEGTKKGRSKTYCATGSTQPEPEIAFGKAAKSYCYELIAERQTGQPRDINAKQLEWGEVWEPMAREYASGQLGVRIQDPIGEFAFISRDPWIGASPDGIIGDDGLAEIHCPFSPIEFVRVRVEGYEASHKKTQIQFQLWQSERRYCEFICYDDRFPDPYYGQTVYRDETYISTLAQRVYAFRDYYLDQYCQLQGVPF